MQDSGKALVTLQELIISTLAQSDALAKLLIEKGILTHQEFLQRIADERAGYQTLRNPSGSSRGFREIT
jgi:hypothetical protein